MCGTETIPVAGGVLYSVASVGCYLFDYFKQLPWYNETVILMPRKGGKTELAQRLGSAGRKRKIVDLDELMKLRSDLDGKGNLLRADNHPDPVVSAMARFEILKQTINFIRESFKLERVVFLSSDVHSVRSLFDEHQIVACYQSKALFERQTMGMSEADKRVAKESRDSIKNEFP